jgi:hypothetical protein
MIPAVICSDFRQQHWLPAIVLMLILEDFQERHSIRLLANTNFTAANIGDVYRWFAEFVVWNEMIGLECWEIIEFMLHLLYCDGAGSHKVPQPI